MRNFDELRLPLDTKGNKIEEELTGYLGPKSKPQTPKIIWTTSPPSHQGRQQSCDVITGDCGIIRYPDHLNNIRHAFESMFDDEIIETIVENTNKKLDIIIEKYKDTDIVLFVELTLSKFMLSLDFKVRSIIKERDFLEIYMAIRSLLLLCRKIDSHC